VKTRAVRDGDHYVVNGSKTFITNGYNANLIVLAAGGRSRLAVPGYSDRIRRWRG